MDKEEEAVHLQIMVVIIATKLQICNTIPIRDSDLHLIFWSFLLLSPTVIN